MYSLNGKVAIVTGTSNKRGLGRGIALRLAREGADIVVSSRSKAAESIDSWDKKEGWQGIFSLAAEIKALGSRALAVNADVSDSQQVYDMVEKALAEFGKIDILVNNAAVVVGDVGVIPVVDLGEEAWNKSIATNLTGTFLVCKAVAKHMIKQGQGGKIINISSQTGKQAKAGCAPYCCSKFGIIGLTQCLALELAPHKINVNAVCPGAILTWGTLGPALSHAMSKGLNEEEAITKVFSKLGMLQAIPLGRVATVDDVANVVAFLASSESDYMTGQAINVTGGTLMAH